MSSDVETIRRGFGAWSRGDLQGALAFIDPDVEFLTSGLYPGLDPVYRGHEGFTRFFGDFRGPWEAISLELEQVVEATPQHYVAVGHFRATARDGLVVERPVGIVVTMKGGTIARMQNFASREEALEAAGLPAEGPAVKARIRAALEAWSRGDLEGSLVGLDPGVEIVTSQLFPGVAPTYHGHDGYRQFWHDFRDTWEDISFQVEHLEGDPPLIKAFGEFRARGRDGIEVGRPIAMVFDTTADTVLRMRSFASWDDARAAG